MPFAVLEHCKGITAEAIINPITGIIAHSGRKDKYV